MKTNTEQVVGEIRDRYTVEKKTERDESERETPCAQEIFIPVKTSCVILILWFSSYIGDPVWAASSETLRQTENL